MTKTILITGATGKQGRATIDHLVASDADLVILAVTRNVNSEAAQTIAAKSPKVKLLQGDVDYPAELFKSAKEATQQPIWAVFCVLATLLGGVTPEKEEQQGKALVDESIKQGVQYFVYSSVDRGDDKSLENPTYVPHFLSKHNVELHILDKTANGSKMAYCFMRPVAFLDQLAPPYGGSFAAMWKGLGSKSLQLIAVSDIGYVTAQALLHPEKYQGKAVSLAGFDMTYDEGARIFKEKMGYELPVTVSFTEVGPPEAVNEWRLMVKWFAEVGYGSDIEKLRKLHPELLDWQTWLEKESGYAKTITLH